MSPPVYVLTGCSGGGKSTLADALGAHGWTIVPEAGRQVVRAELARGGGALPWRDGSAFAARAAALSFEQIEAARAASTRAIITDRSVVDLSPYLDPTSPLLDGLAQAYARIVFFAPPWEEIFACDAERRRT